MGSLAITYKGLGKYVNAEKLEVGVLDIRTILAGEEHPDRTTAMNNLAVTYAALGRYAEAEMLKIKVLSVRNRLLEKSTQIQLVLWVALQLYMRV